MKKALIPIIIVALLFNSCKKDDAKSSVSENKIIGNWLVVDAANEPITLEWGLFYVNSTKLYADKSFRVNLWTGVDDNKTKNGTWVLNENLNSIIFYSVDNDAGTIYRDTTEFNISFDSDKRLVFKNDKITITHIKLDN
jgi:hypothetical protein